MQTKVRLGDAFTLIGGGTPSTNRVEYWGEGTPWFSSADIDAKGKISYRRCVTQIGIKNSTTNIVPANTVIVVTRVGLGKIAILPENMCFSQDMQALLAKDDSFVYSRKYLYYQLVHIMETVKYQGQGTTISGITKNRLADVMLYMPGIEEQQRIVARIEELFSQLDDAEATLQKTKAQLALYRQAVLREAFEGKLTEDWRKRNGTTKQCLIQLAREKRDTALACRKLKPLKYEWKDDIILPSIPHEWEYAQIGDIAWSIKDGPHYSPEYSEEGVPFITGGNVRPTGVDFQSAKRISMDLHKELCKRCCPEKGDMLYTKGGTTGIAHVNTYDQEFSVWVHVAVIKFVDSVLPEYFQHVLNSPLCYQQSQKYTHGVGNQDLGLTRMINIIFPICSIEEQKQIVANLESRLSVCDSIEQTIDAALQQAKAMRQSILKDAFEGRL